MKVTIYHKDGSELIVDSVDAKEIINAEGSEYSTEKNVSIIEEPKKQSSKKQVEL